MNGEDMMKPPQGSARQLEERADERRFSGGLSLSVPLANHAISK